MRAFGRVARVSVGTLGVSDLDLEFDVKRTLSSAKPNTCELTIYNLSETHRSQIARGDALRLEVGYREGTTLLFSGTVRDATSNREKVDWITKISARDGGTQVQTSRALRSFAADTSVEGVTRALAELLGVGVGNASEALRSAALSRVGRMFPEGTVLSGATAKELSDLLRSVGLEWSVQDGVLQLLARGRGLQRTAVRLHPDTGLVGSPSVSKSGKVTARTLLIPDVVPGRRVQIESAVVHGVYRIASATYKGQTNGADWNAELVCETERAA